MRRRVHQERQFPSGLYLPLTGIAAASDSRFLETERSQGKRDLVAGTAGVGPQEGRGRCRSSGPGERSPAAHRLGGHEFTPSEGESNPANHSERPESETITCSLLRSRTAVTVVVQDCPSFDCTVMRAPTRSGGSAAVSPW